MQKKIKISIIFSLLFYFLIINNTVQANGYVRENSFLNATGQTRIAEIKRFQALNNLVVTGNLDSRTKDVLYNSDYRAYDSIENPPSSGLWIVINKTKKILTVYNGRHVDVKFPVTLGSTATPTPSAKAKITNLAVNPAWGGMNGKYKPTSANDPNNPLGERWMGLAIPGKSGYGIHGTIKPREIGTYVSNGCIRMFNYDIENFVFPKMTSGVSVWIGTDAELNNWGVYQYVDKISNNEPQEPIVKPAPETTPITKPIVPGEIPSVVVETPIEEEVKEEVIVAPITAMP